jgi:2-polyprenyl-6-methoxyphenol hydroxylase-like FAD-dependent oxidoreductase
VADVTVIGAGPVGLLLAGQLNRAGVDVELLERRPTASAGSRAIGVHAPALAALEPSGVTERLLERATRVGRGEARSGGRVLGVVRFDRLSVRFPFVATIPQAATEAVLAADAPAPTRSALVSSVLPRGDRVVVRAGVSGFVTERESPIVVVASGASGRDLVYREGAQRIHTYPDRYVMSDAATPPSRDDAVAVVHLDAAGVLESFPLWDGQRRFVAWDAPDADPEPEARLERLRAAVAARGYDASGIGEASGFGVRRFVAPRLRNGRIFAIGDVAHEVSPIGGQGMNLGFLDAATLAPLLVDWVRTGTAPDAALHEWERRRVASARTAARLAAANTALGRRLGPAGDAARRTAVRAMLARPVGSVFARAYAMGFDRDARG